MSSPSQIRRADRLIPDERARKILADGYCGRLATIGPDGYPYGRFECDSSIGYVSVIAFGRVRVVEDEAAKQRFFEALMTKYAKPDWDRPKGFFPRMNDITVYAMTIERLTGKEAPQFAAGEQWPAVDRTRSPNARPPGGPRGQP